MNGSLHLLPFPPSAYTAAIHAATYTCKASSTEGTILSRPVRVRAVVRQFYEVQVYDEFVISGNTAVLKCHVPSFVRDYVTVTSWIRGNGGEIQSDIADGGRYSVFPTGELHIRHVTKMDEFQSYQCVTKHVLSRETSTSAVAGRLMVNDPRSSVPPRITDSRVSVRAAVGVMIELPCAAQGYPIPQYKWYKITGVKKQDHQIKEIHPSGRIKQVGGSLLFYQVLASDAGKYVCVVSSNVGEERTHTTLDVWAPLTAHITPQIQTVDVGGSAYFNCSAEGFPLDNITWLKDGKPIQFDSRVHLVSMKRVSVQRVNRRDRGMYQCVIYNDDDSAQGSAQLKLGDASPQWLNTSGPHVVSPGAKVTLECHVQGSPPPELYWTLRGQVVTIDNLNAVTDTQVLRDTVTGRLYIPSVAVEDGGVWSCSAANRAGRITHKERLNVRGPPSIRPMVPTSVVAGQPTSFDCIVVGYPIDFIFWEKNGVVLPVSPRQTVHPNGTLEVKEVSKESDSGVYSCVATAGELSVKAELIISVMVPPEIDRRLFSWGNGYPLGSPARIMCVVLKGDLPLKFTWFQGSRLLESNNELTIRYLDDQTSILLFHSLVESNAGNYSCTASNQVASDSAWSPLLVKVAPTWQEEPEDISVVVGATVKLPCNAHGAPPPKITWRRAQGAVPRQYVSVESLGDNVRISKENKTLIIKEIKRDQGGELLCIASNGVGSDLSKAVKIFVKVPPQFEIKEENVTITAGNRATLSCLAYGNLSIKIKWSKGDPGQELSETDLRDENKYAISNTVINATQTNFPPKLARMPPSLKYYNGVQSEGRGLSSSIRVSTTTRDDSDVFSCFASNVYGNDTKIINLIVQEVPMAVGSPKVTNTGSRSINLSWSPPSHDGNSPITSYRVLIINSTDSWMHVGRIRRFEVSSTSVTIGGLKPAHSYLVRVLATNGVGTSPPSSELRFTTVHEPPTTTPTKVRVSSMSPTSLKVTWKMSDVPTSQLASYGYYIGYKLVNASDPVRYETKQPSSVSLYRQEAILTNLRKFSSYVITVQAFNEAGAGPKSTPVVSMTDEDVPGEAPSDVFCSSLSSTSILVKWKPPNPSYINGVLRGYQVFYVFSDESKKQSVMGTSATILGLTPYTNYSVSVAAFTRVGNGIKSDPVFCLTDEDVPGPVMDLKGLSVDRSSILVSWLPPDRPNGIILKYALTMRRHLPLSSFSSLQSDEWLLPFPASHSVVDSSLLEFNSNNNNNNNNNNNKNNNNHNNFPTNPVQRTPRIWQVESDSERSWIIPGNENQYLVGGLNERTSYSFNVRAATVVGEGPPGASVTQKPRHDPPAAIASFSRQISALWGEELRLPCKVVGTPPPVRQWTLNGEKITRLRRGSSSMPQELGDGSLLLREVRLSDEGNYSCSVVNDHGKDDITYNIRVKVPPSRPLVYISDVTNKNIALRWRVPNQGEENILGHKIHIKREFGDWKQIEVRSKVDGYDVKDLDCGVRYQVYVVAFNHLGTSEPSDVIATRTLGREPIVPTRSSFLSENATSLALKFTAWKDGGCPITSFVIEYQTKGSNTWRMVSNYVRWNEDSDYVIKNLVPETTYVLRVTAHNSAGSSIETYPFSTHFKRGSSSTDEMYSTSHWMHETPVLVAIIAASLLVLVTVTLAVLFSRRKAVNNNEANDKNKPSATIVPENLSPMNGTTTLIRRKSMNILEAYVPSSTTPVSGDTPTYYTFEMEAPPPSPLQSIRDGTLPEDSLYAHRSRRRDSGSAEYSTLSPKNSPAKAYSYSKC